MRPVELLLSKLPDAKRHGKAWSARCPAHEDKKPSLSISEGEDGRALICCHAGCTPDEIVAALGLKLADLMPEKSHPTTAKITRKTKAPTSRPPATFATNVDALAELERQYGPFSAIWTYENVDGDPVGLVIRWNTPTGKTIRPASKTSVGWIIGGMPEPRPLYRLPNLLRRKTEPVFVVEGEKCVDAVAELGLLTTTSSHGSQSASKTDWTPLADREVVILPDNDEAGTKYAGDVAGILSKLTPPATVRVVRLSDAWPDLAIGGDIADLIASEGADVVKAKLAQLLEKVTPKVSGPVLTCMADVEPREIKWLWPGRVPLGRITLLVGRPGEGKSFLTTDMAARITTGTPWPDGSDCPAGSVILVSAEDDPGDTIRPRLDAHNADVRKVHLLSAVRRVGEDGQLYEILFTLEDVASLEAALKATPDCRLIVVDPIGSFLGGDTDSHRDNEVRAVLAPVAKLAEKYGPAVLAVAHRRKGTGSVADDLALGSRAFTGIARAVWHLTRDKENKSRRLLLPGKNNLAPEGNGLAFHIVGDPAAVAWEHDPVDMSADDALAQENGFGEDAKPGPEPDAQNQATDWLADELADMQEHPTKDIQDAAKEAGLAWRTVQKASKRLNVKVHRTGFGGGYVWQLTKPTPSASTMCAALVENDEPGAQGAHGDFSEKSDDSTRRTCHPRRVNSLGADGADDIA
ncbi:MAG: AAA family ATPase [Phycisphaerales bacterium]|nr:AAA family ATPase [Phycisphaerales bacterium]